MRTLSLSEKNKQTKRLCIWCKSSSVAGTCRTETWHQHNKQRWTTTRWRPHQIDNHNNQFRNYLFIIYLTKKKNNMKTHLAQTTSSSTKKQNSKSGHAVTIKIICVITDHALRVHSLRTYDMTFLHEIIKWLLHFKWQWSLDIQEPNNHGRKTSSLLGFTMWIHWSLHKNHLFSNCFPTWINCACLYTILEPSSFKTTTVKPAKNILTTWTARP